MVEGLKRLRMRTTANTNLVRALEERWIPLSDLSEILHLPVRVMYDEICNLARNSSHYVVLLRDGEKAPRILLMDRREWKNLLKYVSLLKLD